MDATAVIVEGPRQLALRSLALTAMGPADVLVDIHWSGISSGTEKLLWTGEMPRFPGMGYPLVPGYETVGRVVRAASDTGMQAGQRVFVPGANCFTGVKSLFGGAASRLVVSAQKVVPVL